jgi:hypothetical protein
MAVLQSRARTGLDRSDSQLVNALQAKLWEWKRPATRPIEQPGRRPARESGDAGLGSFPPRRAWGTTCGTCPGNDPPGHLVQIITRAATDRLARTVDGIAIWRVPCRFTLHVHLHALFVNRLVKVLEPDLDLIHLHTPWFNFLKRLSTL